MFGFFKPKLSLDKLAARFAFVVQTILTPEMNPKVDEQIDGFVAAGATKETLRLELAAFNAFNDWAGMATSLQKKKLTEQQFDQFYELFDKRLLNLAHIPVLYTACSYYFDKSLNVFINERMNVYATISASSEPSKLVDTFCEFVCTGEPSARLKLLVLTNYYLTAGNVADMIAWSKIV